MRGTLGPDHCLKLLSRSLLFPLVFSPILCSSPFLNTTHLFWKRGFTHNFFEMVLYEINLNAIKSKFGSQLVRFVVNFWFFLFSWHPVALIKSRTFLSPLIVSLFYPIIKYLVVDYPHYKTLTGSKHRQ